MATHDNGPAAECVLEFTKVVKTAITEALWPLTNLQQMHDVTLYGAQHDNGLVSTVRELAVQVKQVRNSVLFVVTTLFGTALTVLGTKLVEYLLK